MQEARVRQVICSVRRRSLAIRHVTEEGQERSYTVACTTHRAAVGLKVKTWRSEVTASSLVAPVGRKGTWASPIVPNRHLIAASANNTTGSLHKETVCRILLIGDLPTWLVREVGKIRGDWDAR